MGIICIIIFCILTIIILKIGFNVKLKEIKRIKEIGYDKELNNIANKFPENKEICETILEKINNKTVEIEEENNTKTSLYMVASNRIIIANIKDTFTRIQTIAHECLHSVQNRKILLFNFIFSNSYLFYFVAAIFLILFNVLEQYSYIYIVGYILMSLIYVSVRMYLENEAMSKAFYVAKEYIQEYRNKYNEENPENKITEEEENKLLDGFSEINKVGIPFTNFYLIMLCLIKVIILCVLALI